MKSKNGILAVIVIAQFLCTSLWFAGNAVMAGLLESLQLTGDILGDITSSVQFGFISGTLFYAFFAIADRFSSTKVFFASAMLAAIFNAAIALWPVSYWQLLGLRFLTGFFLAGIYPVGMKIAADHFQKGLGKSLGFLVGALVLGTAFPHLLQVASASLDWRFVILATSGLAFIGGLSMVFFVADGSYSSKGQKLKLSAVFTIFHNTGLRKSAFGYFGHMWELYTFWAFVPVLLAYHEELHTHSFYNISLASFLIIGIGSLSCIVGGFLAQKAGTKNTAGMALAGSGLCCLLSPLAITWLTPALFLIFLVIWGILVIADSPLFSTLVAQNAEASTKGTALTLVNCIGFSLTIVSIQLLQYLFEAMNPSYIFLLLAIGPTFGLLALFRRGATV
jgi:MFS family permease